MRRNTFAQLSLADKQTDDECDSGLSKRITRTTVTDWRKQNILKKFKAPRVDGDKRKEVPSDFVKNKRTMVPLSIQRIITAVEEATRKASIALRLPHIVNNLDRFAVAMGTELNQLLKYHTRLVQNYESIQKRVDDLVVLKKDFLFKASRGCGVDEPSETNESEIGARLFDDFDAEEDEGEGETKWAANTNSEGVAFGGVMGERPSILNPIISIIVTSEETPEENDNALGISRQNSNQSAKRWGAKSQSDTNGSVSTPSSKKADKLSIDGKESETAYKKKRPEKKKLGHKTTDQTQWSASNRKINSETINKKVSQERRRSIQSNVETTDSGSATMSLLIPVAATHPSGFVGKPQGRSTDTQPLAHDTNATLVNRGSHTTEGSLEEPSSTTIPNEYPTTSSESLGHDMRDVNKNASVDGRDQKYDLQTLFMSQRELDDAVLNLCGVTELLATSFRTLLKKFLVNPSAMEMVHKEARVDSKSNQILELMDELKDLFLYRIMTTPKELDDRGQWVDEMTRQEKINRNTIQKLERKLELINQLSESSQYNVKHEELKQLQMDLLQIEKFADEAIRRAHAEYDKLEIASTRDSEKRIEDMESDVEVYTNYLESDLSKHQEIESELRVERYKIEHELETWIKKYDEEMIEKMEKYEYIEILYTDEQATLNELEDKFADLEREYNSIMEERYHARLAETMMQRSFRRTAVAVMMIQSLYRSFRVRKALAVDTKRKAKEEKKRLRLERKAAKAVKEAAKNAAKEQATESVKSAKRT